MYRRIVSLFLIALLLCLSACGSQPNEDSNAPSATQQDTGVASSTAPVDTGDSDDVANTEESTIPPEGIDGWYPAGSSENTVPTEPGQSSSDKEDAPAGDTQPTEPSDSDEEERAEDCTPWG